MLSYFNIAVDYSNLTQCTFDELNNFIRKHESIHQESQWDCSIQKTIYCDSHEIIAVLEYNNENYQFTSFIRNEK